MKRLVIVVALLAISGCDSQPANPTDPAAPAQAGRAAPAVERFTSASIEKAKALIKAEPKVIDLMFDPLNAIEWHVAVSNDGTSRHGYAEYLCGLLRDAGATDDDVAIRIVDAAKVSELKDAYRDYSLGAVRCQDGQHLQRWPTDGSADLGAACRAAARRAPWHICIGAVSRPR